VMRWRLTPSRAVAVMLLIAGAMMSIARAQSAVPGERAVRAVDDFVAWGLWAALALWFGARPALRARRRSVLWIVFALRIAAAVLIVELTANAASWGLNRLIGSRAATFASMFWWSNIVLEVVVATMLTLVPLVARMRVDSVMREAALAGLERRTSRARMRFLIAQLTPHFLFNSLNGVLALLEEDPDAASGMLNDLRVFVEQVFAQEEVPFITVADELRLLESYLGVQRRRFPQKLDFIQEVDAAALDCALPSLLLQPLVENAIRHGLLESEEGWVHLSIEKRDERLRIRIENSGLRESVTERIGLTNSRERLNAIYGAEQSLEIHSRSGGTEVTILIPASRRLRDDDGEDDGSIERDHRRDRR
jgi:two-component system, LytTR family, sensor kinase